LTRGLDGDTPDVTVATSSDAWTRFLMSPATDRPSAPAGLELTGHRQAIEQFLRLLARFADGAG
jgi:hypothetical protein